MGVVARSDRDKYSGWPPPQKPVEPETEAPRKRRKAEKPEKPEKEADGNGA